MENHEFKTNKGLNNCIELIYFLYEEIDEDMSRDEFIQYLKDNRKDLKKYGITCNLRSKTLTTWYDEEEEDI
jgi:hypothetical protein